MEESSLYLEAIWEPFFWLESEPYYMVYFWSFMSKILIWISHSTGHLTLVSCECPGCLLTLSCWANYSFTSVGFLCADFASTDCYSYFVRFLQLWKLEYRIYSTFHRIYTGFYTALPYFYCMYWNIAMILICFIWSYKS